MIFLLLISNLFAQQDNLANISLEREAEINVITQQNKMSGSINIEDIEKVGLKYVPQDKNKRTKYYDGCNYHTCDDEGYCMSTLLYCPPPKGSWEPPKNWKKVMEF